MEVRWEYALDYVFSKNWIAILPKMEINQENIEEISC